MTDFITTRRVRTRYAPSPTGSPHVGNLRTALFSWLVAKHAGGDFILRIEDTDQTRLVPGALQNIIASLNALGIRYDEGPSRESVARLDAEKYGTVDADLLPETDAAYGSYFQSQRLPRYHQVVDGLIASGKAYYAFETKEELDAARLRADALKRPYLYDRKFRDYALDAAKARIANGEAYVVRFKMPTEGNIPTLDALRGTTNWDATTQDDFVILKADGYPPYHLAVIVDDHDMEITHVLRGEEWLSSSPKHFELYNALGWELPVFVHAPYVLGNDGKKLSKRTGAKPVVGTIYDSKSDETIYGYVDHDGILPEALFNNLSLCGWAPGDDSEIMSVETIIEKFTLENISRSPGIFDVSKLIWMNGIYIRQLSKDQLIERALPFLQTAGLLGEHPSDDELRYASDALILEQEKLKTLADAPGVIDFFFPLVCEYESKAVEKWLRARGDETAAYLTEISDLFEQITDWSHHPIGEVVRTVAARHNRERLDLAHPVRVAVSGRETGPGLFETIVVLGRDRVRARLREAIRLAKTSVSTAS